MYVHRVMNSSFLSMFAKHVCGTVLELKTIQFDALGNIFIGQNIATALEFKTKKKRYSQVLPTVFLL